jgi:predicted unusual protein kinase regulating ubiquinone biosynthesis (AarF/ABC1/UbiB family)
MEGIGRQLDPEVDVMHMAAPYVLHAVANRAIEMVTPRSYYSS